MASAPRLSAAWRIGSRQDSSGPPVPCMATGGPFAVRRSPLEAIETVIFCSEEEGALVRDTVIRILACLAAYGDQHGLEVLSCELNEAKRLAEEIV